MKKSILAIIGAITLIACDKENNMFLTPEDTFIVKGYSNIIETKTAFGTPSDTEIPYKWTKDDFIWLGNNKSNTIAEDCTLANFQFKGGTAIVGTGHVFYNMTGEAKTAKVLANQTADGNLGNDGDFGYAVLDEYNSFYLSHKTSYLWFNTTSKDADMPKLLSISLKTEGVAIAGERVYNFSIGEWEDAVSNGSPEIVLAFDGGYQLQESNAGVMAAMVMLPAEVAGTALTVTYNFEDGSHYTQNLNPTKDFTQGKTLRVSQEINKSDLVTPEPELDYVLRVLTFEDEDTKFEPYECEFYYAMLDSYDYKVISKWSDFIPTDGQYGNGHGSYEWYDEGNTELAFVKPEIETWWGISGHAGVSNYVGTCEDIVDDFALFMYDLQAYNVPGGANGSKNFCSQYGYLDPEEYATIYSPSGVLPGLQFKDEVPRVIDHMYVTNTSYAYQILIRGECDFGGSYELTDDSTFKIVAYGYDSFDDTEPTISEFYLLNTGQRFVTDWTKWDLSSLGEVVRVEFNLVACYQGYGRYGLVIPAYFAYDDVAVRFPKN
ncbi:MAG: DUF4465 domain-containing protein [Bacteroidales bacterium]|nr:DUF4465 domain-containing protein [Bacteroidales bacterium]